MKQIVCPSCTRFHPRLGTYDPPPDKQRGNQFPLIECPDLYDRRGKFDIYVGSNCVVVREGGPLRFCLKEWSPFIEDRDLTAKLHQAYKEHGMPDDHAKMTAYVNTRFHVTVNPMEQGGTHLSIKYNDRRWLRDWREFQRIKNELCGPEFEGLELYPAESRVVDTANQFHLWVLGEGEQLPVGFPGGLRMTPDDVEHLGATQRETE